MKMIRAIPLFARAIAFMLTAICFNGAAVAQKQGGTLTVGLGGAACGGAGEGFRAYVVTPQKSTSAPEVTVQHLYSASRIRNSKHLRELVTAVVLVHQS